MSIDLILVSLIVFFALLGALSGAARQVANVVSLIVAWIGARPIGALVGPELAPQLKIPTSLAMIAATVLAFIVIVVAVRIILTRVLQRILDGKDPESRTVDRTLGFVLGGAKVAATAWVMICALSFVEENVTLRGKRLGLSPKDSVAFDLAQRFNLFELTQFSGVKDLARVATAASDPQKAGKLRQDPAFQRLAKDPRFQKLLDQKRSRAALQSGDYRTLIKDNAVLQLIQDPQFQKQLEAASAGLDG